MNINYKAIAVKVLELERSDGGDKLYDMLTNPSYENTVAAICLTRDCTEERAHEIFATDYAEKDLDIFDALYDAAVVVSKFSKLGKDGKKAIEAISKEVEKQLASVDEKIESLQEEKIRELAQEV